MRGNEAQGQHLLRDFTHVMAPGQKAQTDTKAGPYNWQATDGKTNTWSEQYGLSSGRPTGGQGQKARVRATVTRTPALTPTPTSAPTPVCDAGGGDPDIAYTALPTDVLRCGGVPSLGFEATGTNEFGDAVGLRGGGGPLGSVRVEFVSLACQSGSAFDGTCVSAPGATYIHPITANVYAVDNSTNPASPGALLATVTQAQAIGYRPTADPVRCTGPNLGDWFNPASGMCERGFNQILTFTFPVGTVLPSQVIWTVAFNTTHSGYNPIGEGAACFSSPSGCPYDALNVGAFTFPNAPYAGTDLNSDVLYISQDGQPLQPETGTAGFTPLGEVRYR
ncbi:hypothetical protein JOL79_10995 [Microbispora sp. RL4-1S]|uniref:Uncharacterized protein n=1 Tax=Microbispora oryzae TaxID=2806554 RepID=A0A941AQ45_9ACTN|nr:hypothetical protein [Microbispora oryzae]MBP2704339.1 hypothetical protein [Microbispora oryzae]